MALRLTVLGCSGSYPAPGSACSGYLVRGEGTAVWIDAGNGTMANLQRHVALTDVDAVVLTHEHPDHWSDLEGFYVATRWGEYARAGVPVYAPAGLRDRLSNEVAPTFAWHEVADGDDPRIGGLSFRFSRTDHGPETLAVRVDGEGTSFAYSADTGPGWSFDELGHGLHLALCEATYTSDKPGAPGHLYAEQAGELARRARVERLLLTHFWPTVDRERGRQEATAAFGAPVETAVENEEYHL